jgi:membrane fusion protein, macrolide-specific efflux system
MKVKTKLIAIKKSVLSLPLWKKFILFGVIAVILWFGYKQVKKGSVSTPQYQTATVQKGTIVVTVSDSGTISSVNSSAISTNATGVVKSVFVKDGDNVKSGDKIAEIDLDLSGKQSNAQSYASYQSAKNNVDSAQATLFSSQSTMLAKWKLYMDTAQNNTYENSDGSPNTLNRTLPQFMITNDDWLASEAQYKVQTAAISQAQTALSSAWFSYQQSSPIVVAPISGKVSGLSLQVGSVISSSGTTTSGSTTSNNSTKIANIITDAKPVVSVSLTQIDVPKVTVGDKATITLDAFPDITFAGTVVSIDTVGSVSSGVTSYSAVISLDTDRKDILSNMSATAAIITQSKTNTLTVPVAAVQSQSNNPYVRLLVNGNIVNQNVTLGLASDSDIEILSGVKEGDIVVTNITQATTTGTTTQASPFGGGGGGIGNVFRVGGGAGGGATRGGGRVD